MSEGRSCPICAHWTDHNGVHSEDSAATYCAILRQANSLAEIERLLARLVDTMDSVPVVRIAKDER